jgi:hypothetical protein
MEGSVMKKRVLALLLSTAMAASMQISDQLTGILTKS